jgi:hypothetical protein
MNAEIIRFVLRPNRDRQSNDFPTIAFRAVLQPAKPATKDSDTAPCEYVPPAYAES